MRSKKVYVVRGNHDGILGVYTNKKAISKASWQDKEAYYVSYSTILKELTNDEVYAYIEMDHETNIQIEVFYMNT